MKTINVLITDDHQITREGLKQVLLHQKGFVSKVDEAGNGNEAVFMTRQFSYDIIIMDIHMPEMDGIAATEAILRQNKNAHILALSMFDEKNYILSMVKAGALGYILKNTGAEEIIKAVETVSKGKKYFSSEVSLAIMEPYFKEIILEQPVMRVDYQLVLTKREKEVLKEFIGGGNIISISESLNLSKRTVENHKYRIMEKLKVTSTAELLRLAIEQKIV